MSNKTPALTWKTARTVADLGTLMADWLEGRIATRPGYCATDTDPETAPLLPVLVAANRAGFVTDNSQPGCDEAGFDGARWRQRAAVDGWIADPDLYARLTTAARNAGLAITTDEPMVVTTREGEPYTAFGGTIPRRDMRVIWGGINRRAFAAVKAAHFVAIVDPAWGESDRLWRLLDQITREAGR